MNLNKPLSEAEEDILNEYLTSVRGGAIPNIEALNGFFAALACCPELIAPSEYMPLLQQGKTEADDLDFDSLEEAQHFFELISRHWNDVNRQINLSDDIFLPFLIEDEDGKAHGNHWAQGFLTGVDLRAEIWGDLINDDDQGGAIIPIMILAFEHHEDPEMRPYEEPIDDKRREELFIGMAAGIISIQQYFADQRHLYTLPEEAFARSSRKTGRNEPCPCGSGKKFKKCCGQQSTLH